MTGIYDVQDVAKVLDQFKRLESFTDFKRVVMLAWSIEKSGKSHLLGTASELVVENPNISDELREDLKSGRIVSGSPLYVIDTEGKFYKLKKKFPGRDIRVFPVWVPMKDHPARCDTTQSLMNAIAALNVVATFPNGTVGIDSWTNVCKWARKYVQHQLVEGKADGWGLGDLIKMAPSDYEVRGDILSFLLYFIQNCIPNMHIILTGRGKNKWRLNDSGKLTKTGEIEKKVFDETMYFVDVEVYLEKIPLEDGGFVRTGKLVTTEFDEEEPVDLSWDNPTFPKIIDSIKDLAIGRKKITTIKKVVAKKSAKKTRQQTEGEESSANY